MIKIWIQKIFEKSKFLKIRYLFRYLQLGFLNAFRSQKGQKMDTKRHQKAWKCYQKLWIFSPFGSGKNTNNVVENNSQSHIYGKREFFFAYIKQKRIGFNCQFLFLYSLVIISFISSGISKQLLFNHFFIIAFNLAQKNSIW